jgi:hypothetical protein
MSAGRPLKFGTVEELQEKIDAYFTECIDKKKPFTITGLALALDTSRRVLCEYEGKDAYSNAVKKAKLRCENFAEELLFAGSNAAGAIFALKNYGWRDKQEQELTGPNGGPQEHSISIEFVGRDAPSVSK